MRNDYASLSKREGARMIVVGGELIAISTNPDHARFPWHLRPHRDGRTHQPAASRATRDLGILVQRKNRALPGALAETCLLHRGWLPQHGWSIDSAARLLRSHIATNPADFAAQARCNGALFECWSVVSWFSGPAIRETRAAEPVAPLGTGYGIHGKPDEASIAVWFKSHEV